MLSDIAHTVQRCVTPHWRHCVYGGPADPLAGHSSVHPFTSFRCVPGFVMKTLVLRSQQRRLALPGLTSRRPQSTDCTVRITAVRTALSTCLQIVIRHLWKLSSMWMLATSTVTVHRCWRQSLPLSTAVGDGLAHSSPSLVAHRITRACIPPYPTYPVANPPSPNPQSHPYQLSLIPHRFQPWPSHYHPSPH